MVHVRNRNYDKYTFQLHDHNKYTFQLHDHNKYTFQLHDNNKYTFQLHDHNILCGLSEDDLREVVEVMKHSIISTDLALYFGNRTALKSLYDDQQLDLCDSLHKERLCALMMTCSDLCAVTKPWSVQQSVVQLIKEEFYNQVFGFIFIIRT